MKKTKLIMISFISILLVGLVIGGILSNKDASLTLSSEDKTSLSSIGITKPSIGELVCDGTTCRTCMRQIVGSGNTTTSVGAGCISISQMNCTAQDENSTCINWEQKTEQQLTTDRDVAIKRRLEGIANATRQRQEKSVETKLGGGEVTLSDK